MKRKINIMTGKEKVNKEIDFYFKEENINKKKKIEQNIKIDELGSWIKHESNFIDNQLDIYKKLKKEIKWEKKEVIIYGKSIMQPRLIGFQSTNKKSMKYSGIEFKSEPISETMQILLNKVNEYMKIEYNSIFCNFYENGNNYIGPHSDSYLTNDNIHPIVSLSFGTTRKFYMKNIKDTKDIKKYELKGGDIFLMGGNCQKYWKHYVPKELKIKDGRINLTFRIIK